MKTLIFQLCWRRTDILEKLVTQNELMNYVNVGNSMF